MTARALVNIGELTTNDPTTGDGSRLGRLDDAALVIDGGVVVWAGPTSSAPSADEVVDCGGRAVVPGFVDSHTHLVFAGDRADEFVARMAGTPYDGGGILTTVTATRAASTNSLLTLTRARHAELLASGVTTVEVKSGYDLTVAGEKRLLEVAREVTTETTWLGAHTIPPEFRGDRSGYVDLLTGEMLNACRTSARWCDVFCDAVAFSVEESRAVLEAGRRAGLGLRVHANQLSHGGGVQLAVALGAASVDHCTYLDDADVDALSGGDTVATLLPSADFLTRSPGAPGRRLVDAGATVAIATDCNPGTSWVTSMPLVIALAVRDCGLTPDEALWAATMGGARALQRADVGHLSVGASADIVILDAPRAVHLAYRPGAPIVSTVIRSGHQI